jgi:hypothetical protein
MKKLRFEDKWLTWSGTSWNQFCLFSHQTPTISSLTHATTSLDRQTTLCLCREICYLKKYRCKDELLQPCLPTLNEYTTIRNKGNTQTKFLKTYLKYGSELNMLPINAVSHFYQNIIFNQCTGRYSFCFKFPDQIGGINILWINKHQIVSCPVWELIF